MPELGEVEYFRDRLESKIAGKTIIKIFTIESGNGPRHGLFDDKVYNKDSVECSQDFINAVQGCKVKAVHRKGKQLWFELEKDYNDGNNLRKKSSNEYQQLHPLFHLGMTGCFLIQHDKLDLKFKSFKVNSSENNVFSNKNEIINSKYFYYEHGDKDVKDGIGENDEKKEDSQYKEFKSKRKAKNVNKYVNDEVQEWPPRFTKCELVFNDSTRIAFRDPRRFGRIHLKANPTLEAPIVKLAYDPYLEMPSVGYFKEKFSKSNIAIKALLLDQQKVVCGLGNWLVDEILFQARVHPESCSKLLSEKDVAEIHKFTESIVSETCKLLLSKSSLPKTWLFHYRWGKGKTTSKKGEDHFDEESDNSGYIYVPDLGKVKIEHITVGGRTSAFCPQLQKKINQKNSKRGDTLPKKQTKPQPKLSGDLKIKKSHNVIKGKGSSTEILPKENDDISILVKKENKNADKKGNKRKKLDSLHEFKSEGESLNKRYMNNNKQPTNKKVKSEFVDEIDIMPYIRRSTRLVKNS